MKNLKELNNDEWHSTNYKITTDFKDKMRDVTDIKFKI